MEIEVEHSPSVTVMRVAGEVDADNCAALGSSISNEGSRPTDALNIDMAETTFLDSSAISELLRIHTSLAADGIGVSIVNPSPAVHRVLEITGLLATFGVDAAPA